MLVAEAKLHIDPNAMAYYNHATKFMETISQDQA
jgi:hypothetical protein